MLAAALAVPLLLAAAPLKATHVVLREPLEGRVVGRLSRAEVHVEAWRTPTSAAFTQRGPRFDVDAVLDTRDPGTRVEVPVHAPLRLADTGPWVVVARLGATLAVLGGQSDGLVVGFPQQAAPPVVTARVPSAPLDVPEFKGPRLNCAVRAMHATGSMASPSWSPSSVMWTVHRAGPDVAGWTPAWAETRAAGLVVAGFVAGKDLDCRAGTGGGFGLRGFGGASDGFVLAREVTLPRGAALYADADGGTRVAVLHQVTKALWLDDGTVRVESGDGKGAQVSLHGLYPAPGFVAPDAGRPTTHGVGSTSGGDDQWPHPCPDAGVTERVCYDEHSPP